MADESDTKKDTNQQKSVTYGISVVGAILVLTDFFMFLPSFKSETDKIAISGVFVSVVTLVAVLYQVTLAREELDAVKSSLAMEAINAEYIKKQLEPPLLRLVFTNWDTVLKYSFPPGTTAKRVSLPMAILNEGRPVKDIKVLLYTRKVDGIDIKGPLAQDLVSPPLGLDNELHDRYFTPFHGTAYRHELNNLSNTEDNTPFVIVTGPWEFEIRWQILCPEAKFPQDDVAGSLWVRCTDSRSNYER